MRPSRLGAVVLAVLLVGCMGGASDGDSGTLDLMVSDQPSAIGDFDRLNVTFSEARVFAANASDDGNGSMGDYETVDVAGETVDLTTVVGDRATSIGNVSLAPGNYTKVELHVDSVDGTVGGESVDVKVPSEKLMVTKPFTVRATETTRFVFDITVVKKGGGQGYNLLPVVSQSGVAGEDVAVERPSRARGGRPAGAGR